MKREAFSLIELLIVVLIIGIVYTLAVSSFQKVGEESTKVSLKNLREYLQSINHDDSVRFLCLDDCKSCNIFVDDRLVEELKGSFDNFLDDSIEVYRYDFYQGLQQVSTKIYFNSEEVEEDVCFSYTLDKKGVGGQVFIKYKKKVYDYTSYLGKTPVYNSLADLVDEKEDKMTEVIK